MLKICKSDLDGSTNRERMLTSIVLDSVLGRNYYGPLPEILAAPPRLLGERKRILDIGTVSRMSDNVEESKLKAVVWSASTGYRNVSCDGLLVHVNNCPTSVSFPGGL